MRIRSILLALDLYDNYQLLLNRAVQLARRHGASLHVVHVLPHMLTTVPYAYNYLEDMEAEAQAKLALIRSEFAGLELHSHLLHGTPKNEITHLAQSLNIDCIVMGSHGKHGIDLLLGSTANGVVHMAKQNVLCIYIDAAGNPTRTGQYQRILLATDLHADNQVVIDSAQALAQEYAADIHVIHVVPDTAIVSTVYTPQLDLDLRHEALPHMNALLQNLKVPNSHSKIVMGHPKFEILHYAKEIHADLIVIGSHGRTGLASALLGSTANAVLHGATGDVFVVRIK